MVGRKALTVDKAKDNAEKAKTRRESRLEQERQQFEQARIRQDLTDFPRANDLERVVTGIGLKLGAGDKENEPPEYSKMRKAASEVEPVKRERTSKFDEVLARLSAVETTTLVLSRGLMTTGKCQLRDDFLAKLRDTPVSRERNFKGDPVDTKAGKGKKAQGTDHSGHSLDQWAKSFESKSKFQQYLQSRNLEPLAKFYKFAQDDTLRGPWNEEAHEGWPAFARSVVEAAKLKEKGAEDWKNQYAAAFEFVHGMTWEEAAAKANETLGRKK